jgi:FKBP-type peptidyl-prolyl cis-trans isomerase FklB
MAAALLLASGAHAQTGASSSQTPPATAGQATAPAAKAPAAKSTPTPAAKSTAAAKPAAAMALKTDKQKGSYAVGLNIGNSLKQQPVELDLPSLFRGISDGRNGTQPLLTDAEVDAALKTMRDQATSKVSEANMKDGETFLAANKAKDGVVTTASG